MNDTTPGSARLRAVRPGRLMVAALLVLGVLQLTTGRSDAAQFCNTTPIIGTGGTGPSSPYPSPIVVSGLTGTVTDVNVTLLDFTTNADPGGFHWAEDTDVMVAAPDNSNVILMADAGGDNDTSSGAVVGADLTFDDEAANQLPADARLTTGTWRPVDDDDDTEPNPPEAFPSPAPTLSNSTTLSTFNGIDPNGTWNLFAVDDQMLGANDISGGWCIDILTTGGGGTTTTQPPVTTTTTQPPVTTTTTQPPVTTTTTRPPATTTSTTSAPGTCGGLTPTITGTSGDDSITGTAGPDVIMGLGGNDSIQGLGGDDVICGGAGNDQILGGAGNDRLFGDAGNDRLVGGDGNDALNGGSDADQCLGDAGTDSAATCESVIGVP